MTLEITHPDLTPDALRDVVLFLRRELELHVPGLKATLVEPPARPLVEDAAYATLDRIILAGGLQGVVVATQPNGEPAIIRRLDSPRQEG